MKKGLLFVIITIFLLGLTACGSSKVTYEDPQTGEKKEMKIEKTANQDEVVDSIYAVMMSDKTVKSTTKEAIDASFSIDIVIKEEEQEKKYKLDGKVNLDIELDNEKEFYKLSDLLKAISSSCIIELKGSIPTTDGATQSISTSSVELYLDGGTLYVKTSLDSKLANYLATVDKEKGTIIQLINDKVVMFDITSLIPDQDFDDNTKKMVNDALKGEEKTLKDLLNDAGVNVKELRAQIDSIVKELGITVSKVSGSEVTYKIDLSTIRKNSIVDLFITIDVSDVSLVGMKASMTFNDEELNGTVDARVDIAYKAKVSEIGESDKENAIDGMTLLNLVNNNE